MIDFIQSLFGDFLLWLVNLFDETIQFFTDLALLVLEGFLDAVATLIESIPVPQFLSNGLAYYLTFIDPSILYFLDMSGFPAAIGLLGTGLIFRLSRKLFTLGQW